MRNYRFATLVLSLLFAASLAAQNNSALIRFSESTNINAMRQTGAVRPAKDGSGYLMVGTFGSDEYARAMVIKTDLNFQPQWSQMLNYPNTTIFGTSWQSNYGIDIADMGNNEYVLLANINRNLLSNAAGLQNLDYGLIRFKKTANGATVVWSRVFGGDFNDVAHSMLLTSDGNLLVSGYSNPEYGLNLPGKARAYLVKATPNGQMLWSKTYRSGECNTGLIGVIPGMNFRPVVETPDGKYVFATVCDEWMYITKIDGSGNPVWSQQLKAGGSAGDALDLGDLGVLGGGILSGGTISGIRVMPNGDLAFMGNFVLSVVAFAWDNQQQQLYPDGVALPMGFVFTTSPEGVFKNGQLFFHERFNDGDQPTEMLCQDMETLPDGRLLVLAGVHQIGNSSSPALLKINPAATGIDEGRESAIVLDDAQWRFDNNDYTRGQSNMHLSGQIGSAGRLIGFNFRNLVKTGNPADMNSTGGCFVPLSNVRSLPIQLDIQPSQFLTQATLPSQTIAVQLAKRTVQQSATICMGTNLAMGAFATDGLSEITVAPNPSDGRFRLLFPEMPDQAVDLLLYDALGRLVYSAQIQPEQAAAGVSFDDLQLLPGAYYLHISDNMQRRSIQVLVH